jgi:catechol 1,2-dioxygenase
MSEFSNIQLFDPNLTQNVINATGPQASPRMRKVIGSLIQHLHDFMRENVVTMEELLTVVGLASSPLKPS